MAVMTIRSARPEDLPQARRLAEQLDLAYPGLESSRLWVGEDEGRVTGLVALLKHADCDELVALGVDPDSRRRGLGRQLVESLLEDAPGDVYLATIIPEFFERCRFVRAAIAPPGMAKDPAWCEGCLPERCTIMVRKGR